MQFRPKCIGNKLLPIWIFKCNGRGISPKGNLTSRMGTWSLCRCRPRRCAASCFRHRPRHRCVAKSAPSSENRPEFNLSIKTQHSIFRQLTSEEVLGKGGEADEVVAAGGNGGSAIACGPVIDHSSSRLIRSTIHSSHPNIVVCLINQNLSCFFIGASISCRTCHNLLPCSKGMSHLGNKCEEVATLESDANSQVDNFKGTSF